MDLPEIDLKAFSRGAIVVLVFGAARKDATPEQIKRIREECVPLIKDVGRPYIDCVKKLREIMGDDWEPADEFQKAIVNFCKTAR